MESRALLAGIILSLALVVQASAELTCTRLTPHPNGAAVTDSIDRVTLWYHNLGSGYGPAGDLMASDTSYTEMRQLMIETASIESEMGMHKDAYTNAGKGWAEILPNQAFAQVVSELKKSSNTQRANGILTDWGFNPTEISADFLDCSDDASTIFALEYLIYNKLYASPYGDAYECNGASYLTREKDLDTVCDRAVFWKGYYNRGGEIGLPAEEYFKRISFPDRNGLLWDYSGTYNDGDRVIRDDTWRKAIVDSGFDEGTDFLIYDCFSASGADFEEFYSTLKPNDCVDIVYCDNYYSKPEADAALDRLEEHPLWNSASERFFISVPRLSISPQPLRYQSRDGLDVGPEACKSLKRASFWYPGCDAEYACAYGNSPSELTGCAYLDGDLNEKTAQSCPLPVDAPAADDTLIAPQKPIPEGVAIGGSDTPSNNEEPASGEEITPENSPQNNEVTPSANNVAGGNSGNSGSSSGSGGLSFLDYLGLGAIGAGVIFLAYFGLKG